MVELGWLIGTKNKWIHTFHIKIICDGWMVIVVDAGGSLECIEAETNVAANV